MIYIYKFISFLIFITLISACSNPDEEARKAGFSNMAEMQTIQAKGFKTKLQHDDAFKEVESYAKCNAQISIVSQLANNNGLDKIATEADKFLKGLVFYESKYENSDIKSRAKALRTSEYITYKDKVEKTNISVSDLEMILIDCAKKYQIKIDSLCKNNEFICYGEKVASTGDERMPDGLTKMQWKEQCERFVTAKNECSVASNVSKCTDVKMGYSTAEMSRLYCNGPNPDFNLMGAR